MPCMAVKNTKQEQSPHLRSTNNKVIWQDFSINLGICSGRFPIFGIFISLAKLKILLWMFTDHVNNFQSSRGKCVWWHMPIWKEGRERKINITLYNSALCFRTLKVLLVGVMMNLRADGQGVATNYHNCVLVVEGLLEGIEEFLFPLKPIGYVLNLVRLWHNQRSIECIPLNSTIRFLENTPLHSFLYCIACRYFEEIDASSLNVSKALH